MKYNIFSLILSLFPLISIAGENSFRFAQYDSNERILSIPEVGIDDARIYYNEISKLHLGQDGNWNIVELGDPSVNNPPLNNAAEIFKINNYDSETGILSMPVVEVDHEISYRDVKIQLGSVWNIIQSGGEFCDFTVQQAAELQECMTLEEIESIVGCSGVHLAQGSFASIGQGFGSIYIWEDLEVTVTSLSGQIEKASSIFSRKFGVSIAFARCE